MNQHLEDLYCKDCQVHVLVIEYTDPIKCANCLGENLEFKK